MVLIFNTVRSQAKPWCSDLRFLLHSGKGMQQNYKLWKNISTGYNVYFPGFFLTNLTKINIFFLIISHHSVQYNMVA